MGIKEWESSLSLNTSHTPQEKVNWSTSLQSAMFFDKGLLLGALGALTGVVNAQFPPKPTGLTVLESHLEDGVRISYKEVSVAPPLLRHPSMY
jgi:hypothetical protein